jgi:phytoene dehydrogenase-like protein
MTKSTDADPDVIYHRQPHTLDSTKEPPGDDAPLAQGHQPQDRGTVVEAHEKLKDAVEEEAKTPDVGPRRPGDHAGSKDDDKDSSKTSKSTAAKK